MKVSILSSKYVCACSSQGNKKWPTKNSYRYYYKSNLFLQKIFKNINRIYSNKCSTGISAYPDGLHIKLGGGGGWEGVGEQSVRRLNYFRKCSVAGGGCLERRMTTTKIIFVNKY